MYLTRTYYLDKIKQYINKPFIKVITGQRRVGKTIFLESLSQIFNPKEVVYINKEDKSFDFIQNDDDLHFYLINEIQNGKKYIFCDEIQQINFWEKAINSIFSQYKEVDIYISGSNSSLLSSELATLLSGRYVQFQIFPFSYDEFLEYFKKEKKAETFQDYLEMGGLPLVYEIDNKQVTQDFLSGLIDTVLVKDLIPRYWIQNPTLLKEVFLFLVNNAGNLTNLSWMIDYLSSHGIKTNYNTLASYVEALKSAYLVYEVDLFDLQGKKIFDKERKFYVWDHIFKKVFFSSFDTWLGKQLENIVYLAGLKHGYSVYVGKIKDKEVDFIFEKNGKKIYFQVCYILSDEDVIKREFDSLKLIDDNWTKYVISMDSVDFGIIDGIKHVKMWDLEDLL